MEDGGWRMEDGKRWYSTRARGAKTGTEIKIGKAVIVSVLNFLPVFLFHKA
jgi:hypothetical protein